MEEKKSSNRRSFVRKLLGLGAAAGATSLLLAGDRSLIPLAQAGSGSGANLQIDVSNYGVSNTMLESTATSGAAFAVFATALSGTSPIGVLGQSDSVGGYGVIGFASNANGSTYGVFGRSESILGRGVYGYAAATTGDAWGVYGESQSTSGIGVKGYAKATNGTTFGVLGESASPDGAGVEGDATATTGYGTGVYGYAASPDGAGVLGQTDGSAGVGVFGHGSATSGWNAGVWGRTDSSEGWAVVGRCRSPGGVPIVSVGVSDHTANLQEWGVAPLDWGIDDFQRLSVVDKDGKLGIGRSSPIYGVDIVTGTVGPFRGGSSPPGSAPNSMIFENMQGAGNVKNQLTFKGNGANRYSFGNDISGDGSQNFFIWDEVGAEAVLYVDGSRRVGLGTLSPNATAKLHVAGRVRATGYDTGDIKFANGFTVTENEELGLAFKNDAGDKIAVLDRQGNLHIKGDLIKDL